MNQFQLNVKVCRTKLSLYIPNHTWVNDGVRQKKKEENNRKF